MRDKLTFTEDMKMYDGSKYRGYLKPVIRNTVNLMEVSREKQVEKKEDLVRHGPGVQVWRDGSRYEGEWINGRAHGRGRMIQADGSIYVG